MKSISTPHAPDALGPYSAGIRSGNFVFCSGQTPIVPETNKLVEGDIAPQTRQALANLEVVLQMEGLSLSDIVKTTVFLADLDDFPAMNAAYADVFGDHRPARSTVEVGRLPLGARVEIECIAEAR